MSKVVDIAEGDCFTLPERSRTGRRNSQGLTASDFRRLLSDLSLRTPSHRAVLRRLLKRALANGATTEFPVTDHAASHPVGPS